MNTSETTNGKLQDVLTEIDMLIRWAEADAQHATENDAPDTARDDELRAKLLRKAKILIEGCGR